MLETNIRRACNAIFAIGSWNRGNLPDGTVANGKRRDRG